MLQQRRFSRKAIQIGGWCCHVHWRYQYPSGLPSPNKHTPVSTWVDGISPWKCPMFYQIKIWVLPPHPGNSGLTMYLFVWRGQFQPSLSTMTGIYPIKRMHSLDALYLLLLFFKDVLLVSNSSYEVWPTDVHVTIEFNCILTTLDSLDSLPTYGSFSSWKAVTFFCEATPKPNNNDETGSTRAVGNPPTHPTPSKMHDIYRSVGMPPLLPPLTFLKLLLMEEFRQTWDVSESVSE